MSPLSLLALSTKMIVDNFAICKGPASLGFDMPSSNRTNARRLRIPSSTGRRIRAISLALVFALLQLSGSLIGYESLQGDTIVADASLTGVQDWTAPSTWVGGNVPSPGDRAIIPKNLTVLLDGTDHVVQELVVQGTLRAEETAGVDRALTSNWIRSPEGTPQMPQQVQLCRPFRTPPSCVNYLSV